MEINDQLIRDRFPEIYEPAAREAILKEGHVVQLKEGELLMDIGGYIKYMPLVITGMLKILREDKEGNELLIYYVRPGETCAMSLTCCLGDAKSNVRAMAEEDTVLLAIPTRLMDDWTSTFKSWKSFVLLTYQRRFDELLQTIDSIAFHKLDDRVWHLLKDKSRMHHSKTITTTHQELASELNSSREVISRLLKQMEKEGKVQLGRNRIELLEAV